MAKRELNVFLYGDPVGTLTGSGSLITGFRYQSGYSGAALSRSMPITKRSVGRQTASAWFTGLLPEGEELRRAMADAHGSRDTTSMGLLESAGLDCAGAVQVAPESDLPEREQRFEPISETEIGLRLRAAMSGQPVAEESERWSVAGQQGKIALHQNPSGAWGRALEGLPTTHILKPGITSIGEDSLTDQALTEHLTLSAARHLGIPAAGSEYFEFDGIPAAIIHRYDRVWIEDTSLRIHQEDVCQALGIGPDQKYEERGGPGVEAIASLLSDISVDSDQSMRLRFTFAQMVMFHHFSGSPDAHAKNYSVLMFPTGGVTLAPMYDAASGLGYSYLDSGKPRFPRSAMRIGSHDHFSRITEEDWRSFAMQVSIPFDVIRSERDRIARELPDTFRSLLSDDIPKDARDRILNSPMLSRMAELSRRS